MMPAQRDDIGDIELRVVRLVAAACKCDPSAVAVDSRFDQLGLTSLAALELAFEVESEFGVAIPDDMAFSFKSVREVVDALQALNSAPAPKPMT